MDHVGGNGANGSGNNNPNGNQGQQFNNRGFDFVMNVIGGRQGGPTQVIGDDMWDEIEAAVDLLGLDPPAQMPPVENGISHGDGNLGFASAYNPQSAPNTPGSEPWRRLVTADQSNRGNNPFMGFSMGPDPNKIIQQAMRAMDELVKLATVGEPMWRRNGEIETLNGLQYMREFGCVDATLNDIMRLVEVGQSRQIPRSNAAGGYFPRDISTPLSLAVGSVPLHIEASRDVGFVNMNVLNIVSLLMDWNQWLMAFPSLVAGASLQGVVLGSADGSYNGIIQVMTAEFHQPTPLVPARQSYFARYCKMITNGTWAVVDVCLENLLPYPQRQFRRRPSGCLIEQMPCNGSYSKITWVEHVEADHTSLHRLFGTIVASGFAFGARRWIAALSRHCKWLAASMATTSNATAATPADSPIIILQPGKESVLRMAERMMRKFFMNVSPCPQNSWMRLPSSFAAEDVRIRFGNILEIPGRPPTNTLIFTTSFRMLARMKMLFNFLRDVRSRILWDFLLRGQLIRELAYLKTGELPEDRVSIIQVNSSPNTTRIFYLQASHYDESGSYIIYEPVNLVHMNSVLTGGNPDVPFVLPAGFTIIPEKPPAGQGDARVGTIITMAVQIDTSCTDQLISPTALNTIHSFLGRTVSSLIEIFR